MTLTPDSQGPARRIMGCPCVPLMDEGDAIDKLAMFIADGRGGYTVAVNSEKVMLYRSRSDVREVLDSSLLPYPDGAGAVIGLKLLHGVLSKKIDMPRAALAGASYYGWRTFIVGASAEVNAQAVDKIRQLYPRINIVGRLDGYQPEEVTVTKVREERPEIVLAALGSPRQELFASRLTAQVPGAVVVGCGGALDILAGTKSRAPSFMVNYGLEWLYRLYKEPSRWRRQAILPVFFLRMLMAVARQSLSKSRKTAG